MPKTVLLGTEIPIVDSNQGKAVIGIRLDLAGFAFVVGLGIHDAEYLNVNAIREKVAFHIAERQARLIHVLNVVIGQPVVNASLVGGAHFVTILAGKRVSLPAGATAGNTVLSERVSDGLLANAKLLGDNVKANAAIVIHVLDGFLVRACISALGVALRPCIEWREINTVFATPPLDSAGVAMQFAANLHERHVFSKKHLFKALSGWLFAIRTSVSEIEVKQTHGCLYGVLTDAKVRTNLAGRLALIIVQAAHGFGLRDEIFGLVHKLDYTMSLAL